MNSKNRLIMDIVQQYRLEKKYGISARGIQKVINKLVDKGKLDRMYQTEQKKITKTTLALYKIQIFVEVMVNQ